MKSQTPTWAIVVAILMMLIGGCGIKNDVQFIKIRSILDMKDKILENIGDDNGHSEPDSLIKAEIEVGSEKSDSSDAFEALKEPYIEDDDNKASDTVYTVNNESDSDKKMVKDMFGAMLDIPEKTIKKIIVFGYIGLFFSFLFLLGGLFLLIKKSFSIKLAYGVLGANVLFSLIRWAMLSGEGGTLLSISNSVGAAFTIFGCIILFVVIISSDKSHYDDVYTD